MATTAEMQAMLAKLEKACDDYILGRLGVSVSYDGYTVTLNKTNIGLIKSRIRELKRALGIPTGRRSYAVLF